MPGMGPTQISLLVMGGSAIGGLARYWLALGADRLWQARFVHHPVGDFPVGTYPVGTLLVNVLGSFAIALIAARWGGQRWVEIFVLVGILGGFTTFSAFSRQTIDLMNAGRPGQACIYAVLSVVVCVGASALGYRLGYRLA